MKLTEKLNKVLERSTELSGSRVKLIKKIGDTRYYMWSKNSLNDAVMIANKAPKAISNPHSMIGKDVDIPFLKSKSKMSIRDFKDGKFEVESGKNGMHITPSELAILMTIDKMVRSETKADKIKDSQELMDMAKKSGADSVLFWKKMMGLK